MAALAHSSCWTHKARLRPERRPSRAALAAAMAADGETNIPEGIAWGWRLLSAREPFTQGRANDAAAPTLAARNATRRTSALRTRRTPHHGDRQRNGHHTHHEAADQRHGWTTEERRMRDHR